MAKKNESGMKDRVKELISQGMSISEIANQVRISSKDVYEFYKVISIYYDDYNEFLLSQIVF